MIARATHTKLNRPQLHHGMTRWGKDLPPLVETDITVIVHVHIVEELGEPPVGYGQLRVFEGRFELFGIQFAVAVLVDGLEEDQELSLGLVDKCAELCPFC